MIHRAEWIEVGIGMGLSSKLETLTNGRPTIRLKKNPQRDTLHVYQKMNKPEALGSVVQTSTYDRSCCEYIRVSLIPKLFQLFNYFRGTSTSFARRLIALMSNQLHEVIETDEYFKGYIKDERMAGTR